MSKPDLDRFEPEAAGRIKARIAGRDYRLRRPTIGEEREWGERLTALSAEQTEARADDTYDRGYFEERIIDWWRDVFATLDTSGDGKLPDDIDEFPPWILSSELIVETRQHWATVPWGPGGSPSQRIAREQAKAAESLRRVIDGLGAPQQQL